MAFGKKKRMQRSQEEDADTIPEANDVAPEGAVDVDEETHEEEAPLDPLEAAEKERDDAVAQLARATADYQNLRRRVQSDIDAAVKRARADILGEAVTVLDYLDMALAAECTTDEGKNLQIGVSMTRDQLKGVLDRFQVKEIDASGAFDASVHQAFATVTTEEHEPGSIVEVMRRGFRMGDDVLRHAQVKVAAVPEPETPEASENVEETPSAGAED